MEDSSQQDVFEKLENQLAELTEALFDRSPRPQGRFNVAGIHLTALCRGPAFADDALEQLERYQNVLPGETMRRLAAEFEVGCMRLLRDINEPCSTCSMGIGGLSLVDCSYCGIKAANIAKELETFAKAFIEDLTSDSHVVHKSRSSSNSLSNQAIRDWELECESYRESLEQLQKALEDTSNEKEALKSQVRELDENKSKLQQANVALENELQECIGSIERYADDLDIGMRWQTAQMAYASLYKHRLAQRDRLQDIPGNEETRKNLEVGALTFKHKQVLALVRLGRYAEAEPIAKNIWDRRKELSPANDMAVRAISKDYCDILRRVGKPAEAEREYIFTWYAAMNSTTLDLDEEEWKLDTASRVGEVMAEQFRYNEAASWHRRVLEQRLSRAQWDVEKAAAAAVRCLSCQRQLESGFSITDNTIINDLEKIWRERKPNEESEDVLACGHELGTRLQSQGRDDDAVPILLTVWERRKSFGEVLGQETMATALALVDLSVRSKNLPRLESLYHWVLMHSTPDQSESDRLWCRYRLAVVQAMLEKWAIAQENLRKVLDQQTGLFGADDADSLQFTQVLAEVIRRQGKPDDARNLVRNIWDSRDRHPRSVLQAILRMGHLLGDIMMESNSPDQLSKAENILGEVWGSTSSNFSVTLPLTSLVPSGDCYGMCLMKNSKFAEARPIFVQVVEWKRWLNLPQTDIERSSHLHSRAIEWGARKPPPKYRPPVSCHPLRLEDFLDRWYSPAAATAAITDR